jgi:hypothetical protein
MEMRKIFINLMTYDWVALPVLFASMLTRFFIEEWNRVITLNGVWANFFRAEPGSLFQMKGLYLILVVVGAIGGVVMLPTWFLMTVFYVFLFIMLLYITVVFLGIFVVKKRN